MDFVMTAIAKTYDILYAVDTAFSPVDDMMILRDRLPAAGTFAVLFVPDIILIGLISVQSTFSIFPSANILIL